LVSSIDLPVEAESIPLHLVGHEPRSTELEVARLVAERPELQRRYGGWVAGLHPAAWREVEAMARATGKALQIDLRPAIESLGLGHVLEQVGIRRVIEEVGLQRVLDEVGLQRVLDEVGEREVIKRIGVERFVANLSAAERRELKRQLEG
jgi:hypothetical protein